MRFASVLLIVFALGCGSSPGGTDAAAEGTLDTGVVLDAAVDGGSASDVGSDAAVCPVALPLLHTTIFAMVDQSSSMSDAVGGGGDKWDALTGALHDFLASSPGASTSFGMQYFPQAATTCPTSCGTDADCGACGPCFTGLCLGTGDDSCNVADYDDADVSIRSASDAAGPVMASTSAHSPTGGSPTSAALQGALSYARTYATAHTDEDVSVVLLTDGEPTECDTSLAAVDAIASAALPTVHTAVVFLGDASSFADDLAAAGGTTAARGVDLAASARTGIGTALASASTQRCAFAMPAATTVTQLRLRLHAGTSIHALDHVTTCDAAGGYTFDVEATPARIELCSASCAMLRSQAGAAVEQLAACTP